MSTSRRNAYRRIWLVGLVIVALVGAVWFGGQLTTSVLTSQVVEEGQLRTDLLVTPPGGRLEIAVTGETTEGEAVEGAAELVFGEPTSTPISPSPEVLPSPSPSPDGGQAGPEPPPEPVTLETEIYSRGLGRIVLPMAGPSYATRDAAGGLRQGMRFIRRGAVQEVAPGYVVARIQYEYFQARSTIHGEQFGADVVGSLLLRRAGRGVMQPLRFAVETCRDNIGQFGGPPCHESIAGAGAVDTRMQFMPPATLMNQSNMRQSAVWRPQGFVEIDDRFLARVYTVGEHSAAITRLEVYDRHRQRGVLDFGYGVLARLSEGQADGGTVLAAVSRPLLEWQPVGDLWLEGPGPGHGANPQLDAIVNRLYNVTDVNVTETAAGHYAVRLGIRFTRNRGLQATYRFRKASLPVGREIVDAAAERSVSWSTQGYAFVNAECPAARPPNTNAQLLTRFTDDQYQLGLASDPLTHFYRVIPCNQDWYNLGGRYYEHDYHNNR